MQLSERYREILGQLVSDYIATSAAVGSRELSKKTMERLSPATVRNVLKDLEDFGYLQQPHTSAGRIPTEKGLRFYVDSVVERHPLTPAEHTRIQNQYDVSPKDVRSLMKGTGQMLATLSKHVGIVLTPKLKKTKFKHIEFLPLSRGKLLGIFVTQTGNVENRVLEINQELKFNELERINNYCNASFIGLTLEEAKAKVLRELAQQRAEVDRLLSQALLLSQELLGEIEASELVMEGEILRCLQSLEEQEKLLKVLNSCAESPGVRIFIGRESLLESAADVSIITATYQQEGSVLGTLGVIGPTHMDYAKVISIVDVTANMMSHFLENWETKGRTDD